MTKKIIFLALVLLCMAGLATCVNTRHRKTVLADGGSPYPICWPNQCLQRSSETTEFGSKIRRQLEIGFQNK